VHCTANIDVYLSSGIKATSISGRNLPDISTVIGRAVTPSTREDVGRPRLTPPEMLTTWHYASKRWIRRAGRLPFMPRRIQGPAPVGIKLKLFSANPQHVDAQAVTII
jgi:hypothetical protein